MKDFTISNDKIQLMVSSFGGEIKSLTIDGVQLLWEGDDKWWDKTSPILFPNIGFLRDNKFVHSGKSYELPKHGLLRTSSLKCLSHRNKTISFEYNTVDSKIEYPFDLTVTIIYEIDLGLSVKYIVKNNGNEKAFFSIGSHPAIKLFPNTKLSEYKIQFSSDMDGPIFLQEGLLKSDSSGKKINELHLNEDIFCHDALIFKGEELKRVHLIHVNTNRVVTIYGIYGCSHFALWAPVGAPFICLEPWRGRPDSIKSSNDISKKAGIVSLGGGEEFSTGFCIYQSW